MNVIESSRTRPPAPPATEPRTVCLTFGPAATASHLLRTAAEALDHVGAVATAIEPSADQEGSWLRVTCDVDPALVARLVAMPSLGDHRVDHRFEAEQRPADEHCPACELRAYLRAA